MATLKDRLTGSSGYAFQDGTMRGAIAALMNIGIALTATVVSIDAQQLALIFGAVNPALFVAFGIYDRHRSRGP